jgi:hypothetical protein
MTYKVNPIQSASVDPWDAVLCQKSYSPPGPWSGTILFSYVSASGATFDPVGSGNTRALQFPKSGAALGSGPRNFIYLLSDGNTGLLTTDNTGITAWRPVGQSHGSASGFPSTDTNTQRFDYSFGAATGGYTGYRCDSQLDAYRTWDGNLSLTFGSFYLEGEYDFCGSANAVSAITTTSGSHAVYNGLGDDFPGIVGTYQPCATTRNYLDSDTYNIVFGASGRTGTLQFSAINFTYGNGLTFSRGGTITVVVNPP